MAHPLEAATSPGDALMSPALLAELTHLDSRERFAVLLRALIEHYVPASVSPKDAAYFLAIAAQDMLESPA